MKYTAINIGPIVSTFSLARNPRELWAASYIFSYLMSCIIKKLPKDSTISPALLKANADKTVGLYPDRVFVKGEVSQAILDEALVNFAAKINFDILLAKKYFNIMSVTIDAGDKPEDTLWVIPYLNSLLDRMELCNLNTNEEARVALLKYLSERTDNLSNITGKRFKNISIETIASINFFEDGLAETGSDKSDKYICIVQADGDNMGKVISALSMDGINTISESLLAFGQESCQLIRNYGGLPIYAGGDDLLFMAPVSTTRGSIFDLIDEIDNKYATIQNFVTDNNLVDKEDNKITTSMSYGISMTYGKFPLYEALQSARELLFEDAKNVKGKNAMAWILQKHSGSSFKSHFSKNNKDLFEAFKKVIETTENEQLVSAVAHKIRNNEGLLSLWLDEKDKSIIDQRLSNFFNKIVDGESKDELSCNYISAVKNLLMNVYFAADSLVTKKDQVSSKLDKMKELTTFVYGMLRTAKFIKGKEEDK